MEVKHIKYFKLLEQKAPKHPTIIEPIEDKKNKYK